MHQVVVDDDVGGREPALPAQREQPGIAGAGADQAHAARSSSEQPARAARRAARCATVAARARRPPARGARLARRADMRVPVDGRSPARAAAGARRRASRAPRAACCSRRRSRRGTRARRRRRRSAAAIGDGGEQRTRRGVVGARLERERALPDRRQEVVGARAARPPGSRGRGGRGRRRRARCASTSPPRQLAEPRVDVAAQEHDLEVGAARQQLRAAADARGADARAGRERPRGRRARAADQHVARRPRASGTAATASPGAELRRDVLHRVHRAVDARPSAAPPRSPSRRAPCRRPRRAVPAACGRRWCGCSTSSTTRPGCRSLERAGDQRRPARARARCRACRGAAQHRQDSLVVRRLRRRRAGRGAARASTWKRLAALGLVTAAARSPGACRILFTIARVSARRPRAGAASMAAERAERALQLALADRLRPSRAARRWSARRRGRSSQRQKRRPPPSTIASAAPPRGARSPRLSAMTALEVVDVVEVDVVERR